MSNLIGILTDVWTIFFYVPQKKANHMSLEQHEGNTSKGWQNFHFWGAMLLLQQVSETWEFETVCFLTMFCLLITHVIFLYCSHRWSFDVMVAQGTAEKRTGKYLAIWYAVCPNTCHHDNVIPTEILHEKIAPFKVNLKPKMYKTYTLPFESLGLDFLIL